MPGTRRRAIGDRPIIRGPTHGRGKFLYAIVNLAIVAFAINTSNGALNQVEGSPYRPRAYLYNAAVDPASKHLYATTGWPNHDLLSYAIDPHTGALSNLSVTADPTGAPYSIAVTPDGAFLYVGGGVYGSLKGAIVGYAVDSRTDALTGLSGSPFMTRAQQTPIVAITPSGAYLYATNSQFGSVRTNQASRGSRSLQTVGS